MKKIILLVLFSFNLSCFAQHVPANIVSINKSGNTFTINFTLPSYTIKDTSIAGLFNRAEIFSYIDIQDFGVIDEPGDPQLPQLSFDLRVPSGATNFTSSFVKNSVETKFLLRNILPAQEDLKESRVFNFNTSYYNSIGSLYNFNHVVEEPYIVFGEKGINVSIFPFTYNPTAKRLEVVKNGTLTITFSSPKDLPVKSGSDVSENYLAGFFENYIPTKSGGGTQFYGRYLMITAPEYESTLTYFANYKRNIGYDVTVVNTNTTGTGSDNIKNYIKNRYDNKSTRPDFVLLVGDHDKIPASGGNSAGDKDDDPITDLHYARLDGDDYHADVFLGRFSVENTQELQNIINKTIYMETNLHKIPKKAKFLSGDESNIYMRWSFNVGHLDPERKLNSCGFTCERLQQPNTAKAIAALNENPTFFVYSGHGSFANWGGKSFDFGFSEVNTARNTIYPFVFAFACKTGNFAYSDTCIGEKWIRSSNGGVTYFGSSVNTLCNTDVEIEKKIFGNAFTDEQRIGAIINLGKKHYMKRFWAKAFSKRTRRFMKSYNLLGDPSLNILGKGCIADLNLGNSEIFNAGSVVTYQANNTLQTSNIFQVANNAKITLLAGSSIVLNDGFLAGDGFQARNEGCTGTVQPMAALLPANVKENQIVNPAWFSIFQNPGTSEYSMSYIVEEKGFVNLSLYNEQGKRVVEVLNTQNQLAGNYYYNFDLDALTKGSYYYQFKTPTDEKQGIFIKN